MWEISLKYALGKLCLEGISPDELPLAAKQMQIESFSLQPQVAASFYQLPANPHRDPFDQMIIWQAISSDLALLSDDSNFKNYQQYGLVLA